MEVARGQVSDRPFARTIYTIAARRFSGDFVLTDSGRRYAIAWREGVVVGAEIPSPGDTAGRVALAAGLVSSTVVAQSLTALAQRPGASQLEILIQLARLGEDQVATLRRRLLIARAVRSFALPDASFTLDDGLAVAVEPVEPIDVRWLIFHGLRTHYTLERLERELAPVGGRAMQLAADGAASLAAFGFTDASRPLLDCLRTPHSLPDLALAVPELDRQILLATVYALVACDCLSQSDRTVSVTAPPESRPHPSGSIPPPGRLTQRIGPERPLGPATVSPPIASPRDAHPMAAGSGRVRPPSDGPLKPPTRPPGSDPLRPASIPPRPPLAASPDPLRPASRPPNTPTIESRARGASLSPPTRPPLTAAAIGAANRLRRLTGVPVATGGISPGVTSGSGSAAAVEIRQLIQDKLAELDGKADHYKMLSIPRSAAVDDVRAAYFSLARRLHPDRLRAVGVTELAADSQRLFASINQAFAVLSDPTKRAAYKNVLAAGGEEAIKKSQAEAEALATKLFAAEDAFRKGEMALRRSHFEVAKQCFEEAVALNPNEAEHVALLAWAIWVVAADKAAVLATVNKRLGEAIHMSPRCVPAHFYRAMVAKQSGKEDAAIAGFNAVLELAPEHGEASLELRVLASRNKDKKGLFGKKK